MLTHGLKSLLGTGRGLLVAMLALLHGGLMLGVASPWAPPLLLAHLGLFLLWQPLWRGERKLGPGGLSFIALAALMVVFWLSWWAVAFWLTGLFGLVGARVFAFRDRWSRVLYLSVMIYLLSVLLLWVVPSLFQAQATMVAGQVLMWYLLPLLLLLMALIPVRNGPSDSAQTVDFIYSLLLFMLLTLVVLGSLAFMSLGEMRYQDAVLRTLFLMGLLLLALGWLWNPRFGFSGLQVMFSRYLLNVGTPFESWLARLADAAQHEHDAASYLLRVITLLSDLPWLVGLSWQSPDGAGQAGEYSGHAVLVEEGELRLTMYARHALNPTLQLHVRLLAQLIGYFYQSKQHEQRLRDMTRLQTVYETGSRLTHDLKNMLQSLFSLTSIAQSRAESAQQLLLQQLPLLTQRIEMVLVKLQQPQVEDETPQLALKVWWDALKLRNRHRAIKWLAPEALPDIRIPSALFDCVIDNLVDNATRKLQIDPGVVISIELQLEPLRLTVCDTGEAAPPGIAVNLMRGVVASENGLGIGLYQAARWAAQLGYRLMLLSNQKGKVCFELRDGQGAPERRNLNY
jgi:signal transduction histidine kinase